MNLRYHWDFIMICITQFGLAVILPKIFGNIENTVQLSISSHLISDRDSFTTIAVSSLQECRQLCRRVTSCVLGNYRSRGHLCKLEHYKGTMEYSVIEEKMAGYVSWRNKPFDTTSSSVSLQSTVVTNPCRNCNKTQSCVVQAGTDECETFACGDPHRLGTINLWGNINTLGGKFLYGCYDHIEDWYYSQYFECSVGGTWSGLDDICGYEDYEIDGEPFKLKIVNKKVNKTDAIQKCANEGANVTNILTWTELKFFKRMSNELPGEFWIDLERVGEHYTLWRSSIGQEKQINTNLWLEYTNVEGGQNCAYMHSRKNWRLNDIQCWYPFYYICEMTGN